MSKYLLRVNNQVIQTIRLRNNYNAYRGYVVVIEDAEFGAFCLTSRCLLEVMDLSKPIEQREMEPGKGWQKVGLLELIDIAMKLKEKA